MKFAGDHWNGLIMGLMLLSAPALASVTTFNGIGLGAIPDGPSGTCSIPGTPLNTSFVVSGVTGGIQDIRVSITFSPPHTWGGDVTATLIAPGGSPAFVLFGRRGALAALSCGSGSDLAGPYVFVDPSVSNNNFWSNTSTPVAAGTYMTTPTGGDGVSNPPAGTPFIATFSGLTAAQINGTWTLRFTDSGAGGTGSVSATALTLSYQQPSAPIAGTVTAGNSQAWLGFTPPAAGGDAPITGYTATCTPLGSGSAGPNARTILVTGLRNDVPSTCLVRATNSHGAGMALSVDVTSHATMLGRNDSGQSLCFDGTSLVACTTANAGNATSYDRQDARFGRDAAANAGLLTKTGGGNGGFDFTRICNSGEAAGSGSCPASPVQGSGANEWGCTRDNVTGLVWLLEAGFGNWAYATETYPTLINTAGRCGYTSGWWLPTVNEYMSIVDYSQYGISPTIDQNYFPADYTTAMMVAWSATPASATHAWYVWFGQGVINVLDKSNNQPSVRLVHPSTGTGMVGYIDNNDGTISDRSTALMWDKCAWGLSGATCTTGTTQTGSWSQALGMAASANAVNHLGYADWRLPSVKELQGLIDFSRATPALDPLFPGVSGFFWSSTPVVAAEAMTVEFGSGYMLAADASNSLPIRLVRGGKSYDTFDLLAPRAPTLGTATAGNGKVTISFTPAASGPAATTYTASCTDGSTVRSVVGTASPIIVGSLTNDHAVTCSVTAANSEGSSLASASADATPHATVPDAPSLLRLIPGDRSMKLIFSAPASNGGAAITGYVATCTGGGHTHTSAPPATTSPIVLTGLTNYVSYTCSVHATNSVGSSSESTTAVKVVKRSAGIAPLLGIIND